eukprot:TRINITY_DN1218_c0_g1_i1.p1 TRINITY_DN1218_c0_g1~~TRINITY_DN1218_c0_g1_i1.p1  ORF type:complete len:193 (+),score=37.89 TRINITY_DN1218_c0_g1_i1:178-756(+)
MNNENNEENYENEKLSNNNEIIITDDNIWDHSHLFNMEVNKRKIKSLGINSWIFGNYEFKELTGIYLLEIKISNYYKGFQVTGFGIKKEFSINDTFCYKKIYGWSNNGYMCRVGKFADFVRTLPLKGDDIMINLQLNTHTGVSQIEYYDVSGTLVYLSDTYPEIITFPCSLVCLSDKEDAEFELINFKYYSN